MVNIYVSVSGNATGGIISSNVQYAAAAILICKDNFVVRRYIGPVKSESQNKVALSAFVKALKMAETIQEKVIIHTNNEYAYSAVTQWSWGWSAIGWKKADGKKIANLELIKEGFGIFERIRRKTTFTASDSFGVVGCEKEAASLSQKALRSASNSWKEV